MRRLTLAAVTVALTAAAGASCRDAAAPTRPVLTDPSPVQFARAAGEVSICHAAGRADDPKFVEITVSENAATAHLDGHGTPQAGHEQDYVITERTPCPPPETPAQVRVCKVGGAGIPAGTPFSFVVDGQPVTVPAGDCVTRTFRVGTRVTVAETVPANTVLAGLTLTPAAAGTTDLEAGTASVVAGTDVVTLTFTNQAVVAGYLKVCKASTGTPAVTGSFAFGIAGVPGVTSVSVPVGQCVFVPGTGGLPAGTTVTITEALNANTQLFNITCVPTSGPGSCTTNVPARTATVVIAGGITSEVTFTNRVANP